MAREFMIHAAISWGEDGSDDLSLWPFALDHADWLRNRIPQQNSGLTPLEMATSNKSDHKIYFAPAFGVALAAFWILRCRTTRSYQSGTGVQEWVSSLVFRGTIPQRLPLCEINTQGSLVRSITSSLVTSLKLSSVDPCPLRSWTRFARGHLVETEKIMRKKSL